MNPLAMMYLLQQQLEEESMRMPPRQDRMTPQNQTLFQQGRRPGVQGSVPFRDPSQGGPMAPAGRDPTEEILFYPGRNEIAPPPGNPVLAAMRGPRG